MFDLKHTAIDGFWELQPIVRPDHRGRFVKTMHADWFRAHYLKCDFTEQYYSVSKQRVLRGLHFQTPPYQHAKLVCCLVGEILDVALDLRAGSPTFGRHACLELSSTKANSAYLAEGLAHGFYVRSTEAVVHYSLTTVYAQECDKGIHWNSAKIAWPDQAPIVSERDMSLPCLSEFRTPF